MSYMEQSCKLHPFLLDRSKAIHRSCMSGRRRRMHLRGFCLNLRQSWLRDRRSKIRPRIPINNQIRPRLQMLDSLIADLIFFLGLELMLILVRHLIEGHELMLEEPIFGIVLWFQFRSGELWVAFGILLLLFLMAAHIIILIKFVAHE